MAMSFYASSSYHAFVTYVLLGLLHISTNQIVFARNPTNCPVAAAEQTSNFISLLSCVANNSSGRWAFTAVTFATSTEGVSAEHWNHCNQYIAIIWL